MTDTPRRPPIRIRFKYNVETGEIEEFIVDDHAQDRSESYHDKVAGKIASSLGRRPGIEDAGPRHLLEAERERQAPKETTREKKEREKEEQAE